MEQLHFSVRPTWRVQWWNLLLIPALLVAVTWLMLAYTDTWLHYLAYACALGAVVLAFVVLYRHFAWRFAVSDDTIESRRGIIGRTVQSIRIEDLRNINVRQSLIERVLGIGSVEFSTAGGGGIEVVFFGIEDPMQLKENVQKLQDDREGSHQATRSRD